MKIYIVREYYDDSIAVFDSMDKAKNFLKKLNNYLFEETGEGLKEEDFSLTKEELNIDFEQWEKKNG